MPKAELTVRRASVPLEPGASFKTSQVQVMANEKQSPRFLEQLRKQSDALRESETAQHRPVEETLQAMDRHLWSAFRWLDEALRHLEVIHPRVQHSFQLLGVLTVDALRYERGFISYRRRAVASMDLLDHVEFFYRLTGDAPVVVKTQPATAPSVEDRLRTAHLQFRYEPELDERRVIRAGRFLVSREITASVRLEPDYRRQRIEVTLNNIDRFESVVLDFAADGLGEPALEDLVHFMLGDHNQFLRRAPLAGMNQRQREAALAKAAGPFRTPRSVAAS